MKIRTILVSMLSVAVLAGCNGDDGDGGGTLPDNGIAYLSISIETQQKTRSSSEDPGVNESDIKTLYVITFDDAETIVGVPGTSDYFIKIDPATLSPDAFKISASATKLLVIANPGPKMQGVISAIGATTTFATVNTAITAATKAELTDEVIPITHGFTMINSGDEGTSPAVGSKITTPLIEIGDKIQKVTDDVDEVTAKDNAGKDENRVDVKVERLVSKVKFTADNASITVKPTGATFAFGNWTLDAVNSTFYPFAEKTLLEVAHSGGGFYVRNFYTEDPNFSDNTGILYTTIDKAIPDPVAAPPYAPVLVDPYGWMDSEGHTYCIENTMDAPEQKFGNATRVVVKGTYYPNGFGPTGDWFNFAGVNYKTFADLQTDYGNAAAGSALKLACNGMYTKIEEYATKSGGTVTLTGTDFATLTVGDLAQVVNGGEVIKNEMNNVIRWYQNGLNYYYYEIKHDNEATADMAFAKYGVVRNNWYQLTLTTINGPGTPWYPDVDNPGPGDPDPTDPIDEAAGYLGVKISVAPWILWNNEVDM